MKSFSFKPVQEKQPITPDQYYRLLNYKIALNDFVKGGFFKEHKSSNKAALKWAAQKYDELIGEINRIEEFLLFNEPLDFSNIIGKK